LQVVRASNRAERQTATAYFVTAVALHISCAFHGRAPSVENSAPARYGRRVICSDCGDGSPAFHFPPKAADRMSENDTYLVRITSVACATGSFIGEICRGDGLTVLQRSTKNFPTRLEALFGAAQNATSFA